MSRRRRRILGRLGISLVAPGILSPLLTLTRAQASGARSTALNVDGTTWAEYAADVARFNGTARRLLIEGQRTNLIRNLRWAGATPGVIGSGGVAPTNMNSSAVAGLTWEIVQVTTVNGAPVLDLRITTTGAVASQTFNLETASGIPLSASSTYAVSIYAQIVGGSTSGFTVLGIRGRTDTVTATNGAPISMLGISASALTLVQGTYATPADATAGRASLILSTSGAADITLRLAFPQFELGSFASTPILPAVGTPAASTRGADLITATLASLGIGANGACTVLWSGAVPQAAGTASQTLLQINGANDNDRLFLRNENGGSTIVVRRVTGGVASGVFTAGTMTPGTPFAAGIALDGAGRIAGSFNGGAVVAATGGPSSGLTTFRVGTNAAGGEALFGETARVSILPYALSDAALQAAVAAFPTA